MENFDEYKKMTQEKDWRGICKLNNVSFDNFGTRKEFKILPKCLEDDEVVFAHASGIISQSETSNTSDFGQNTWLVLLTSMRFIFIDCAMLTKSYDMQSVRLEKVQAVSSSQGWFYGKVIVDLGSRVIEIDNCVKGAVAVFPQLFNKWLESLKIDSVSQIKGSLADELKKLAELKDNGVLTDEEFSSAKQDLLNNGG